MPIGELSRATGIPREALRNWREGLGSGQCDRAGFSELRIVAASAGDVSAGSLSERDKAFTLVGFRGNRVTGLDFHHIAALLQAGLL
jgi:hypothetical protein